MNAKRSSKGKRKKPNRSQRQRASSIVAPARPAKKGPRPLVLMLAAIFILAMLATFLSPLLSGSSNPATTTIPTATIPTPTITAP